MQILRPGAGVPACLLQLTGLLGPTLEPGNSGCLCVHAANSPPWGFGWALRWVLCTCGPQMFEAPPPETPGYVLQSQQISAARGHAVSSCSPRQEETLSLQQLSEIPNVLLCPAGMGRRQLGEGRSHRKGQGCGSSRVLGQGLQSSAPSLPSAPSELPGWARKGREEPGTLPGRGELPAGCANQGD